MAQNLVGVTILLLLRSWGWSYYLSPRWIRRAWIQVIAQLLNAVNFRAAVIEQNLNIAFPLRKKELFWAAYRQMAYLIVEVLMLLGPLKRYIQKESELVGVEYWKAALAQGKGVIFLSSHVGNWEVMSGTGALLGGIDLLIVTKLLKPAWLHRAIEQSRLKCGYRGTYEPRTMKDILSQLKKKQTVGFVLDQYAGPPVGIRVPFFGVPVGTHTVVAMLAKRSGAPVLPVVNFRLPDGKFRVVIQPPLPWIDDADHEQEIFLNTARYTQVIQQHVCEHPDQWLWTHKRFKGDLSPLHISQKSN